MSCCFARKELEFDFVAVGGGLTGLCAAIAAARHGVKTALVQDRSVLGGNASSEIRMHICGATANNKKPYLTEGGIIHEIMLENKRVNDSYNFSIWDAVLFESAKKEKNLTLFLNTTMLGASSDGGRVTSIDCYQMTTEKRMTIKADYFADCTGNGTLCAFVNAKFRTGSEGMSEHNEPHAPETANNKRMGNTLLFKAANMGRPVKFTPPVDVMHFTEEQLRFRKHSVEIPEEIAKNATPDEIKMLFDGFAQDYGYWWIEICGEKENIIEEYEDIRDQLVRAVYGIWDHIKNDGDHGAENFELVWVGMVPGTRESRRIECDYMLNENDVLSNRRFDDKVAYGGWHIDNHVGLFAFDEMPSFVYDVQGSYDIPYRSYCVKDFENLYALGRCMGATKLGMASSRVMGTCAIGGQAIGTAVSLLANENAKNIREIDVKKLQQMLLRDDCYLPELTNEDENDLARGAIVSATDEESGCEASNVINGISREIDGNSNAWRCEMDKHPSIMLSFDRPKKVSEIQLTFDSNFNIEKKITLSSRRQNQQVTGVPKELLKDFDIELLLDGKTVGSASVRDNSQRLCRIALGGALCNTVKINAIATNGDEYARIFEIRVY